jgi:hypothetical protein
MNPKPLPRLVANAILWIVWNTMKPFPYFLVSTLSSLWVVTVYRSSNFSRATDYSRIMGPIWIVLGFGLMGVTSIVVRRQMVRDGYVFPEKPTYVNEDPEADR